MAMQVIQSIKFTYETKIDRSWEGVPGTNEALWAQLSNDSSRIACVSEVIGAAVLDRDLSKSEHDQVSGWDVYCGNWRHGKIGLHEGKARKGYAFVTGGDRIHKKVSQEGIQVRNLIFLNNDTAECPGSESWMRKGTEKHQGAAEHRFYKKFGNKECLQSGWSGVYGMQFFGKIMGLSRNYRCTNVHLWVFSGAQMCTFAPPISGAQMCTSKKIIYITPNNENYIDEIILEYLNLWIELFPVSFHVNEKYFWRPWEFVISFPAPFLKKSGFGHQKVKSRFSPLSKFSGQLRCPPHPQTPSPSTLACLIIR